MSAQRISVRLDEKIHQRLKEEVRATGRKESDIVREALSAYFENGHHEETILERGIRLGHFKTGKKLPRDLSTNPKHMEGFGL